MKTIGGSWDEGLEQAVVEDEAGAYGFTIRVRAFSFRRFAVIFIRT